MGTVNIIDSKTYGLSPANENFNLVKIGTPISAKLIVEFTESFGYSLKECFLNGFRFKAQSGSRLEADVKTMLQNGDNKLTINFDALQMFGVPLGQTTISAYIEYQGAAIQELPSITQAKNDFFKSVSKNIPTVIAIVFGVAAIAVSFGYVSSRLPSFGNINVKKRRWKRYRFDLKNKL